MPTETTTSTGRWELKKDSATQSQLYQLFRKENFRVGIFSGLTGSIDFKYQVDAEKMLELLEDMELLLENSLLEVIEDSVAIREAYFKTSPYDRARYNKSCPVARQVGIHNQLLDEQGKSASMREKDITSEKTMVLTVP